MEGIRRLDEARAERDARLEATLRSMKGPAGLRATVVTNTTGRIRAAAERVHVLPLPEVAAALHPSTATTFEAAADNSPLRHRSAAVPLKNKPWHLVLQAPQPSSAGAAVQMAEVGAAAAAVFGLLTILAAYIIARGITAPLLQLADVADRISLGELNAEIRVNRRDEVGDPAEALRRMQVSLQTAIERLRARRNT